MTRWRNRTHNFPIAAGKDFARSIVFLQAATARTPTMPKTTYNNQSPTPQFGEGFTIWDALRSQRNRPKNLKPPKPLPFVKTDLKRYHSKAPSVIWFGHSSYLIHVDGFNILVDPVLSDHASPVSFLIKAFPGTGAYGVADMPPIDCLVITHNHYDHLDLKTVRALLPNVKRVVMPAGVGASLRGLRIPPDNITELAWGADARLSPELNITATPARHFSGRGLRRNGSLWASYVLRAGDFKIFIGGDSGYDNHFQKIGREHGPFDLALLECGQYDKMWPYIHSMPEEVVTEAQELGARVTMPVHWAKFALANHPWDEPIARFVTAAEAAGIAYTTPKIGEPVVLGESYPKAAWWTS